MENRRMNHPTPEENVPERPASPAGSGKQFRPLRSWPALVVALLMLAARFGPGIWEEGAAKYWMAAIFGPLLGCLLLLIWWLVASRANWRERLFGFLGLIAGAAVSVALAHPTMRGRRQAISPSRQGSSFSRSPPHFSRNRRPQF